MVSPYSPNTPADRQEMLRAVGVSSINDLFGDIPEGFRDQGLDIPPALSEMELLQELEALAGENRHALQGPCFLGAGAYNHYIPAVVQAIASRGEFLTAYTPYQPEVSQGTLQVAYEFQTLTCQLLGMEVANAGMYEGATSLAEAALMACRITERYRVAYVDTVSPASRDVLATYTQPQGIQIYPVSSTTNHYSGGHRLSHRPAPQLLRLPGGPEHPGASGPFGRGAAGGVYGHHRHGAVPATG